MTSAGRATNWSTNPYVACAFVLTYRDSATVRVRVEREFGHLK